MRKAFLGLVLFCLLTRGAGAQTFSKFLATYRKSNPTEKIYLQYNKQYYTAGESIWFKAYLLYNTRPGSSGNNFYLQLTNELGKVISNKVYPIAGATASGNIDIPDSLMAGNYYVRAFTISMLNQDPEFIYKKQIHISGVPRKPSLPVAAVTAAPALSMRFFPEGGSFVADIISVVAFKATDNSDNPVDVKGFIKTEDGTIVVPFSSFHDGIGQFRFKPQAGKKYFAVTEFKGTTSSFPLPPVDQSGLAIKVEEEPGGKVFLVSRNKSERFNFDIFKVVAQVNNIVVYEQEFYFGDHFAVRGHLNTDSLPSGILQFTVFNKDDAPILERLTFVNNREYESGVSLSVLKLGTAARSYNSLEFDFPDTAQRSCSVSITDNAAGANESTENIITSFLLTTDLRGKINNPAYYFNCQKDSACRAIDNLLLTHGWRRFSWKKVLNNEYPVNTQKDEYLINISGTLKNEKKTAVVSGGTLNIFIASEDSSLSSFDFKVNESGRFYLDSLLFAGTAKIYYSYKDANGKQKPVSIFLDEKEPVHWPADSNNIVINSPDSISQVTPVTNTRVSDVKIVTMVQKGFENAKELENVTLKVKAKRPQDILDEKYTTGVFKSASRYMIDNITKPEVFTGGGPGTVQNFILHRLPRVGFRNGYYINLNHAVSEGSNDWRIGLLINEMPATLDELDQLRIEQIAIVKFFDAGFIGVGSEYGGGAIAIYTKKDERVELKRPAGTFISYNGYSVEKEFYSPDYSLADTKQTTPDIRNTLYWSPKLYTDNIDNCIQVQFYNNDISKAFKVVLEGFDTKGRLIFLEKTIGDY